MTPTGPQAVTCRKCKMTIRKGVRVATVHGIECADCYHHDVCANCGYPEHMHPVSPEFQCAKYESTNATSAFNNIDRGDLYGRDR